MITCRLKNIMFSRNLTLEDLTKLTKVDYVTLEKWYNNKINIIDLDVLTRICYVLDCKVGDLFEMTK